MIIRFFLLQFKQTMRMLLRESLGLLAAFIVIGLGIVVISANTAEEKQHSLLKVGVSVSKEDQLSRMAIGFIQDYQTISSICSFQEVRKEDIATLMESGQLDAAILIPDSFVEAADSGENIPATFYFPADREGDSRLFREIIIDALSYIQSSQRVVYAAYDVAARNLDNLKLDYYGLGDYLAEKLLSQWGKKQNYFENRVITPFGRFDYYEFYIFVGYVLALVIVLNKITFLYDRPAQAMESYLSHRGMGKNILDGLRCVTVFFVLMIYSGLYYILVMIVKALASKMSVDLLTNLRFPLSFGMTVGLVFIFTLANQFIMLVVKKGNIYLPKAIQYLCFGIVILVILVSIGDMVYRKPKPYTSGIYVDADSKVANNLAVRLENLDTSLDIYSYQSAKELEEAVRKEKIDNGFILTEDGEGKLRLKGLSGMFSFGYPVAEETMYSQIYAEQSKDILYKEVPNIYIDSKKAVSMLEEELENPEIEKSLLGSNIIEIERKNGVNGEGKVPFKFLSLLTGLLLIVCLSREYEQVLSTDGRAVSLVLRGDRSYVVWPMCWKAGMVAMAFLMNMYLSGFGSARALILFPIGIAYILLWGRLFSRDVTYRQFRGLQLLVWLVIVVFMI